MFQDHQSHHIAFVADVGLGIKQTIESLQIHALRIAQGCQIGLTADRQVT
jgi:hypothetical protein